MLVGTEHGDKCHVASISSSVADERKTACISISTVLQDIATQQGKAC